MLSTKGLPHRTRLLFGQSFLCIIGLGSMIFHGTLSWHAQVLLDELPMIWSATMILYVISVGGADSGSPSLKVGLGSVAAAISWLYLKYPYPVFHQIAFACLEAVSVARTVPLIKTLPTASATQLSRRNECGSNFRKGIATFLLGFLIWNVDNLFCDGLTSLRAGRGELLGALTQGHAWWHLLTGLGSSRIFCALTYLCLASRSPDDYEFGYFLGHPYIRKAARHEKSS